LVEEVVEERENWSRFSCKHWGKFELELEELMGNSWRLRRLQEKLKII
jgi:hypothetical protein